MNLIVSKIQVYNIILPPQNRPFAVTGQSINLFPEFITCGLDATWTANLSFEKFS